MAEVITFTNFRPPSRFDSVPWTAVNIEESTDGETGWTQIDTLALAPLDPDPEHPALRSFTTEQGTALDYWYRVIFEDANSDVSQPTTPIQNTGADVGAPAVTAYATVEELQRILHLRSPTPEQLTAMQRVLDSAALEIDAELGRTEPYAEPPALVVEVNLERAVEHWQQQESPFGIVINAETASFTATDSWRRHAAKLKFLKQSWGIA